MALGILGRRLTVVAVGGLGGAIAIGLSAPTPVLLVAGIVALGFAMIAAILFYLIRPVPSARPDEIAALDSGGLAPRTLAARRRPANELADLARTRAEIIPFQRRPEK